MKAWVVSDVLGNELAEFDTLDEAQAWLSAGGLRLDDVWGGDSTAWANRGFQTVAVLSKRPEWKGGPS